jgi:hypothetical protein
MSGEVTVNRSMQAVSALGAGVSNVYSTIVGDTPEDKVRILEAVTNAESLGDHLGETILLKDVVVQATTIENEGVERDALRSILIDAEGNAYSAISDGIFKALQNMFSILGNPNTWAEPLPIVAVEVKGRKGFKFMTIKVAK